MCNVWLVMKLVLVISQYIVLVIFLIVLICVSGVCVSRVLWVKLFLFCFGYRIVLGVIVLICIFGVSFSVNEWVVIFSVVLVMVQVMWLCIGLVLCRLVRLMMQFCWWCRQGVVVCDSNSGVCVLIVYSVFIVLVVIWLSGVVQKLEVLLISVFRCLKWVMVCFIRLGRVLVLCRLVCSVSMLFGCILLKLNVVCCSLVLEVLVCSIIDQLQVWNWWVMVVLIWCVLLVIRIMGWVLFIEGFLRFGYFVYYCYCI